MEITALKQLAVEHDYYCSDTNFFSNDCREKHDTWADFYNEFKESDIDLNLCFRWDIEPRENSKFMTMQLFFIAQRKGIFFSHEIAMVDESDLPLIKLYLAKHWAKLQRIWSPISGINL